jgi:hypothetical protein
VRRTARSTSERSDRERSRWNPSTSRKRLGFLASFRKDLEMTDAQDWPDVFQLVFEVELSSDLARAYAHTLKAAWFSQSKKKWVRPETPV